MKQFFGIYYVDATNLEGWTDETLAENLREPLAEIGIDVEIGKCNTGMLFFDIEGYAKEETLREQIVSIVEKVVTQ